MSQKEKPQPLPRSLKLLQEAVTLAEELHETLKVLGETEEERALTLAAFEGLTSKQLREAATREKQLLSQHPNGDQQEVRG